MCNVKQMKLETKIAKVNELKAQIEALNKEFELVKSSIIEELKNSNLKTAESKGVKVTFKSAVYTTYNDEAVKVLESKGLLNCIKKSVNTEMLKSAYNAGVLNESELKEYAKSSVRESLTVSVKK